MLSTVNDTKNRTLTPADIAVWGRVWSGTCQAFQNWDESKLQGARVIIYGASLSGQLVFLTLKTIGCEVLAVLDSSPAKIGSAFMDGRPVLSPDSVDWKNCPAQFLLIASTSAEATRQIRERLSPVCRATIVAFSDIAGITPPDASPSSQEYHDWIEKVEKPSIPPVFEVKRTLRRWKQLPKISVLMPVYNPDPRHLTNALKSIRRQSYPNWELCIADDCSSNPKIREILERYQKRDGRIRVHYRKTNGHISHASNSALSLVTGEYTALVDHDDLIPKDALFFVAKSIVENRGVALIYSDEDKIDENGGRTNPYFKSDWNPDLFHSHNFIAHLGVYRADILREIGGFNPEFDGSQDYDLALRFSERIDPGQIVHIPRILYHWRIHHSSMASSGASAKPYAYDAGHRAMVAHFKRMEIACDVIPLPDLGGMYRIKYKNAEKPPLVSIIIPTVNRHFVLKRCLDSILLKTSYPNYEVIIVDNGADDRRSALYLDKLRSMPGIRVIRDDSPFNYSALNNSGVRLAQGSYILFLNDDTEVISPDWIDEMMSFATQKGVGAVGARLWYSNNTLQHGGVILGIYGVAAHSHRLFPRNNSGYFGRASLIQNFSAVTAACLLVRKSIFLQVGGFDENNVKESYSDVDLCLRIREAGFRNVYTPYAELYHHESVSRGPDDTEEKKARHDRERGYMLRRWGDLLLNDPAYNKNLTLDYENFSLRM